MATELMERNYSGIHVTLSMVSDELLAVDVTDPLGTETLTFRNGVDALAAFHHPYAWLDASRPDPFSPKSRNDDDFDLLTSDEDDTEGGAPLDPSDLLPKGGASN